MPQFSDYWSSSSWHVSCFVHGMFKRSPAPFAGLMLLSCVSSSENEVLTACPPAPLREGSFFFPDSPSRCGFDDACHYDPPVGLGAEYTDYCNGLKCDCVEGKLSCRSTLVFCSPHYLKECPQGAADGVACSLTTNGECAVPGSGADLEQGIINGFVCACDEPGPIFRCLPTETTSR